MKKLVFCSLLVISPLIWDAYSFTAMRQAVRESQPLMAIQVRRETSPSGEAVPLKPGQTVFLNTISKD